MSMLAIVGISIATGTAIAVAYFVLIAVLGRLSTTETRRAREEEEIDGE